MRSPPSDGTKKQIGAIGRARLDPISSSSPCVAGHMTGKNLSTTERLFLHLLFLSLFLLLLLFHYFSLLILPLSLWSLKSGTRTAWRGSPVPVAPTNSVPTEVSSRFGISQHRSRRKILHWGYRETRGKRRRNFSSRRSDLEQRLPNIRLHIETESKFEEAFRSTIR